MRNLLIHNGFDRPPSKIFFAKVTNFNPFSNTVDVVTIDENVSIYECQIATSLPVGFNFGEKYFPTYQGDTETQYIMNPGDIYCIAAYANGDYNNTVILGFLFPRQTELSIPEYGLYIFRHESDVISLIRGDGTCEFYHPSGSYWKIGEDSTNCVSSDIETGGLYPTSTQGFNVRNPADFNSNKQMGFFLKLWSGQNVTLDKDGSIILESGSTKVTLKTDGSIVVNATTVTVNATNITLNKV